MRQSHTFCRWIIGHVGADEYDWLGEDKDQSHVDRATRHWTASEALEAWREQCGDEPFQLRQVITSDVVYESGEVPSKKRSIVQTRYRVRMRYTPPPTRGFQYVYLRGSSDELDPVDEEFFEQFGSLARAQAACVKAKAKHPDARFWLEPIHTMQVEVCEYGEEFNPHD